MISVIIPTFNEGSVIRDTIFKVMERGGSGISEVIVSDGSSSDNTAFEAKAAGAKVILANRKGRASQMNEGAQLATGSILYFLHADSVPPANFSADIIECLRQGNVAGCFRLAFDYDHWFLKTQAWFTRFDIDAFRYGDQSLFVLKETFARCNGYDSSLVVFEDNEIISRLKRSGTFKVLKTAIITSARKYRTNGVLKTQTVFYLLYFLYRLKFSQKTMVSIFKSLLKQDKI